MSSRNGNRKSDAPVRMSTGRTTSGVGGEKRKERGSSSTGLPSASRLPVARQSRSTNLPQIKLVRSNSMTDRKLLRPPSSQRTPLSVRSQSVDKNRMQEILTPVRMQPQSSRKSTYTDRSANRISGRGSTIGSKNVKDTRPLTDKSYQQGVVRKILDFLRDNNYPNETITSKHFPLSTKEFTDMFNFFYSFLNPAMVQVLPYTRCEETIVNILKNELQYPGQITKSNLISMGSLHSWPSILGCLSFLCESAKIHLKLEQNIVPIAFPSKDSQGFPIDRESKAKLKIEHMARAYKMFSNMHDTWDEENDRYRDRLLENDEVDLNQVAYLKEECQREHLKLEKLQKEPNMLAELESTLMKKEKDQEKMINYLGKLRTKRDACMKDEDQLLGLIAAVETKIKENAEILAKLQMESSKHGAVAHLAAQVSQQLEVEKRIGIQEAEQMYKATEKEKWELEVQYYRINENLKKIAWDFNSMCIELGLTSDDGQFLSLPLPVLDKGSVVLAQGVSELKAGLLDQLRDQKAVEQGLAEELQNQGRSIHARAEKLKAQTKMLAQFQKELGELEQNQRELEESWAREEATLDRNLAHLRDEINNLRSTSKKERDEMVSRIEEKHRELTRLKEFNARRKVEGKKFLAEAGKKSHAHIQQCMEARNSTEAFIKHKVESRREADERALEHLQQTKREIDELVAAALGTKDPASMPRT